jgi:hypothetical protein
MLIFKFLSIFVSCYFESKNQDLILYNSHLLNQVKIFPRGIIFCARGIFYV